MVISKLKKYRQDHLVKHYKSLSNEQKSAFEADLARVDFSKIQSLYQDLLAEATPLLASDDIKPMAAEQLTSEQLAHYRQIGLKAIADQKVALLVLAGGQGSRLGHAGPKGTYDLGVAGASSLFEIQANAIKCLEKLTGQYLPWYILTSEINHSETVQFFERHHYFDLPAQYVRFFSQGMIEAVDQAGKLFLRDETSLVRSPDGNGGCLKALAQHAIIDTLLAKGYQWLFIYNVDNAIINIADPAFVGYAIENETACNVKVVAKRDPQEKVGVVALIDGKPAILDYSEMTDQQMHAVNEQGGLLFGAANIGNYILSLEALRQALTMPLHYHIAHKKIQHLNFKGEQVVPKEANGYKFELFLFDIFKSFNTISVFMTQRHDDFAPVKNATGVDSPETARQLYNDKYRRKGGAMCE